jgi:hypothetical protein
LVVFGGEKFDPEGEVSRETRDWKTGRGM